jgi:hypothetical protein
MAANDTFFEKGVYPNVELYVLPDPTRRFPLKWDQIKRRVFKKSTGSKKIDRLKVWELLEYKDSKKFNDLSEELWPPRTKTDLALRRTRLLDWVKHLRSDGKLSVVIEVLCNTRVGWDLIFVTNVLAATCVFGLCWWKRWKWLGAFDDDLGHFLSVAKKVNDIGKTVGIQDVNWTWYVECSSLGGYRNPPFEGFDIKQEVEKLANGGIEHNYFGYQWDALCSEFLSMNYHPVDYVPFGNFVCNAEWLTSGSSSVGKVVLTTIDGNTVTVKARKNMVADVVDLETLANDALSADSQENYAIIKSELGKLRLAVAGDIYTYLKQTWINYLLGGAYYDWVGNTSEEDFVTQTERLSKMLDLCVSHFGLPYDYAGFDHQPTTDEIVGIVKLLCKHARLNVPPTELSEYDLIADNVIKGFYRSTLETRVSGEEKVKVKVNGGLMSGLRWTSVVGNAWNSVITGLVLKLLHMWGIPTNTITRFIRGDDSAIFVPNWATGAAVNLGYDAVGAKAGEGKFSLQNHQMEFLRVWFDTRCRGYPARALPGLTQRKPWSSNPWSEDMVIKALYDTCRTLKRRVDSRSIYVDKIWKTLRRVWCKDHGLPDAVCWTPTFSGGFGIEPSPVGSSWKISPSIPRVRPSTLIRPVNQNNWRADKIAKYAKERYDLVLGEKATEIASEELVNTISSDNVPSIAREVRQSWLHQVRRAQCKAVKTEVEIKVFTPVVDLNAYPPARVSVLLDTLKGYAPLFGKCPEVDTARVDYDRFKPKLTFKKWLNKYFPRISQSIKLFHKSWHISEILDYLSGHITLTPTIIHPALVKILAWLTASSMKPKSRSTRNSSLWIGGIMENTVAHSHLSQKLYWW